ncbi:MAG: DNA ligase D [Bosea sp. (in: a-proteobacteria)]|uniref:DNA ligase D n=1 Tax=Bosea sp. (in: a-proteobacteria) TaxID=1871050 RepID=UPI003F7BCABC
MSNLDLYRAKRDFSRTREPEGSRTRRRPADAGGLFVVHKHAARRLHYDLRLEHGGVLWSWAVTRGPSLDPDDKRLAVHVEDHPLEYGSFEGTIPKGQYGAGSVIVWDEGKWLPEDDPAAGMEKGHLTFTLEGHKLTGKWHLVRMKPRRGEKRDNWLLIKADDAAARRDEDILETEPDSVKSGVSVEATGKAASDDDPPAKRIARKAQQRAAISRKTSRDGAAVPAFVEPCLATLRAKPPEGEAWLHEVKFDGYRLQARIANGRVKLLTRSGLDWTDRFGKRLVEQLAELPCESALIDGEIVALSETGSSFPALQAALSEGKTEQLVFFAFDLLFLDGEDLRGDPLLARKERLAGLLSGAPEEGALRLSEHFLAPGEAMLRHACRIGLEGVVSKRSDAPYRSGRGRDWIKSKCTLRQEFVIAGYVPSSASGRTLRSIVTGYYEKGTLKPAGRVGTGFTQKSAAALKARLDKLKTNASPFDGSAGRERGIVWVKPELVAEVEFRAWTASKTLRHASFLGLREDKPAREVQAERPPAEQGAAKLPKAVKRRQAVEQTAMTDVKLSSPDKTLWPDTGLTKQGLLDYYAHVWPLMKPFVLNRPLSLVRAPDGIAGQRFFQKHASPGMHDAIRTQRDSDGEELLSIGDFDGLAALVQLGTVEIHVWGATVDAIETPDQIIFDMDPDKGIDLEELRSATLAVRDRLAELGFSSFLKTSGGKGFHVVVPLEPQADWAQVKGFARDFAKAMEQAEPKRFTATLSMKARKGRIFIDYLRNGRGATAIAPYSTRARAGAAVAMPIRWEAIERTQPDGFKVAGLVGAALEDAWPDFRAQARPLKKR